MSSFKTSLNHSEKLKKFNKSHRKLSGTASILNQRTNAKILLQNSSFFLCHFIRSHERKVKTEIKLQFMRTVRTLNKRTLKLQYYASVGNFSFAVNGRPQ